MSMDNQAVLTSFVYEMDAQVLALELQAAGIDARVRKDDCGGMRPAITNERGIEILVPAADFARAAEILGQSDEPVPEDSVAMRKERGQGSGCLASVITLAIGLGAGFAGAYFINYVQTGQHRLVAWQDQHDRNGDGRVDITFNYDKGNRYIGGRGDDNFDGEWDAWWTYEGNVQTGSRADTDFNGIIDVITQYENGIAVQTDWTPNRSSVVTRREILKDGILVKELIDENRDGAFDLEKMYDPFGNVISSNPISL